MAKVALLLWRCLNGRSDRVHTYAPSECLTDADEILRCLDSWDWIEISSNIDSYRTDRRRIAQPQTYVVGIKRCEVVKANVGKDVSAVVKSDEAKALPDGQRDAKLRIQNEHFISAGWHLDECAVHTT